MRRSTIVQLTLLPMVAAAAVASADPDPTPTDPYADANGAPGMSEPTLAPPGMTPTADECELDPAQPRCDPMYFETDADYCADNPDDPDCQPAIAIVGGNVIRGGFGGYFWVSHG